MPNRPTLLRRDGSRALPSIEQAIATKIRMEAASQRLTRVDVARATGLPYTRVQRLFAGRGLMLIHDIWAISRVLEVSVADLWPPDGTYSS
jgi:hypothetical protein